ncbi:hypothetical protein GUJ93_ZPchr0670g33275 [Zizania palustris]|uniref:Uncharacterized protein n=1 Tax=Zizania palustris TaxID=103762 RepID=A0A8J5R620_ZIZPA|nr:hypothetical protein GUJ93_ZPchr0670g33275 [Zizania palustris]
MYEAGSSCAVRGRGGGAGALAGSVAAAPGSAARLLALGLSPLCPFRRPRPAAANPHPPTPLVLSLYAGCGARPPRRRMWEAARPARALLLCFCPLQTQAASAELYIAPNMDG